MMRLLTYRDGDRALILATIVLLSVVAVPIGFGGSAVAGESLVIESVAVSPDDATQEATYAIEFHPENVDGEDVTYVDVAFDANASDSGLNLTAVNRTDVNITDADGNSIDVQAVETWDASGDGTADLLRFDIETTTFESGASYAVEVDGVTNPNLGTYDLAVRLRQVDDDGNPVVQTHGGSKSFVVTATFDASDADSDVSDGTENDPVVVSQGEDLFSANEHVDGNVQLRSAEDGFRTEWAAEHGGITVETSELDPGLYYLRSNGTDHSYFEIAEQEDEATATEAPTEPTDTPADGDGEDDDTPTPTEETTPGFGAAVALFALVVATLLATRRD